jgi:two-component system, response regulator PdtaR
MVLRTSVELAMAGESESRDEDPGDGRPPSPATRRSAPDPEARPRILLVEDDYLVGMEVEAGLEEAGFEVVGVAASAEEAVRLAERCRPRLAVMDIRLAGDGDGVEAALDIHRRLGIRSIFASAHVDADVRARAAPARPLGWIAKPYRLSTLLAAVKKVLREADE